jgi:hypothetical protein
MLSTIKLEDYGLPLHGLSVSMNIHLQTFGTILTHSMVIAHISTFPWSNHHQSSNMSSKFPLEAASVEWKHNTRHEEEIKNWQSERKALFTTFCDPNNNLLFFVPRPQGNSECRPLLHNTEVHEGNHPEETSF